MAKPSAGSLVRPRSDHALQGSGEERLCLMSTWGPPTSVNVEGSVHLGSTHIYKWVLQEKRSGLNPHSPLTRVGASVGTPPPGVLVLWLPAFSKSLCGHLSSRTAGAGTARPASQKSPESTQGRSFLRLPVGYKSEPRGRGFTPGATHARRALCSAHQTVSAHGGEDG